MWKLHLTGICCPTLFIYVAIVEGAIPLGSHNSTGDKGSQGTEGVLQQGF